MAWHYKEYSGDVRLANAEIVARRRKAGLWQDNKAIPPWDFRHGTTATTPKINALAAIPRTTPSAEPQVTVYVTASGSKYHADGCRFLIKSKIAIPLSEARTKYGPCGVCKPPQ